MANLIRDKLCNKLAHEAVDRMDLGTVTGIALTVVEANIAKYSDKLLVAEYEDVFSKPCPSF